MPTPSTELQTVARAPAVSRSFTRWTPDDLETAEALTAGGYLQRAADLCWAMLGDGRVKAALDTRVKGLLRLPIKWEVPRGGARVRKALEAEGDWYAMHSEAALFSLFAWGLLLGVGLAQRVWELRGERWIGVLRPYDARNLRWDAHRRVWVVRTERGDVDILPGDKRWVLYAPGCSGYPDGDERPWMYGAWRAIGAPWLGKYFAWGDWQGYGQVHGAPIRTADLSEEKPPKPEMVTQLGDALGDVGGDASVIGPPGSKIRLVEAVGNTWMTFKESIAAASQEIVIALTGQSSSTEIVEGQETGATLHGQVRRDLIGADEQTGSTCLHRLLVDYTAINFGDGDLAPWMRWDVEPPSDAKARGDAMLALGNGLAALAAVLPEGKVVDVAAEFERAGIALIDAPAAPAPAPPSAPSPAPDPSARAHGCGGSTRPPFAHERKIERPIAGARARPAFDPDNPLWVFRLDRGLDPAICDNVCDDHDGKVVRGDSSWWSTHTPPLHFNCHCFVEQLDGADHDETPDDELPDTSKVGEGFGEGALPLDEADEARAQRLEARAQRLEIAPRMWGRPPRDGGTGRVLNPELDAYGRVVPKRSLEIGANASARWPGGWREWDSATPADRRLAVLFIAALILLGVALEELLRRSPPTAGAKRILDTEDGRLRSAVVTENP